MEKLPAVIVDPVSIDTLPEFVKVVVMLRMAPDEKVTDAEVPIVKLLGVIPRFVAKIGHAVAPCKLSITMSSPLAGSEGFDDQFAATVGSVVVPCQ